MISIVQKLSLSLDIDLFELRYRQGKSEGGEGDSERRGEDIPAVKRGVRDTWISFMNSMLVLNPPITEAGAVRTGMSRTERQ